jgi:MipA family protein
MGAGAQIASPAMRQTHVFSRLSMLAPSPVFKPVFTSLFAPLAVLACLLGLPARSMAQTPNPDAPPPGKPAPLWEAGLVGIAGNQPAYPGAARRNSSAIVLPYVLYRGPFLRAEDGSVGVRAAKTPEFELDIGFAGSFGSAARDNDVRRGLPDIGILVEFGPRLKWNLGQRLGPGWGATFPLRGVFDASNDLKYRGIAFEPGIAWGTRSPGGWGYGVSASILLGDRRLADTFYGVAPAFALPSRPAYEAKGGLIATRVGVNAFKRIAPDWRFFTYARLDSVTGAANRDSPLVEKRGGVSVGLGLAWTFAQSDRPGVP